MSAEGITVEQIEHPRQPGLTVEAVHITDAETLKLLRASDWHEGQLSLLTYPSRVAGYISGEPPRALSGVVVEVGDLLLKGPAGDFEVLRGAA